MSLGKLLLGRIYEWKTGLGINFTQQSQDIPTANAAVAAAGAVEVIPTDENASRVKTFSLVTSELDSYFLGFPGMAHMRVPNVLTALTPTFDTSAGSGSFSDSGSGSSEGQYATLSLQIRGSGQGSGAVLPNLIPTLEEHWGQNKPVMIYTFLVPTTSGVVLLSDVLAKLSTKLGTAVNMWPNFQPDNTVFSIRGEKVTVSLQAQVQQYVYISNANVTLSKSSGSGKDGDVSLSIKSFETGLCLHDAITLSQTTVRQVAAAAASASISGGTNFPAISSTPTALAVNSTGTISPESINATSPIAPPSSGLYVHDLHVEAYTTAYAMCVAEVFDFADL